MSFDFPSSPTEGQEFTPLDGLTYVYYSPRWLVKPLVDDVGASVAYVDAQDATKADTTYVDSQDALKVAKAGDTMTGNLIVNAFYPSVVLRKNVAGASSIFGSISGGSFRWEMQLGDEAAESGTNAGSDFNINNYADGGLQIATPISINRASSVVTFSATPTLPAANPTTALQAAHKQYVDDAIAIALNTLLGTGSELRFTRTSSQHMTRLYGTTSSSAWTLSMWVKRVGLATRQALFGVESTSGAGKIHIEFDASNQLSMYAGAAGDTALAVGPVYNSTTLWYNIVWSAPSGAPSTPKFHNLYVNNGSAMTGIIAGNDLNVAVMHYIGQPSKYPDVIMKDVNFVDGAALTPTAFGEDVGGVWTPKVFGGPFGANGFKLHFNPSDKGDDVTSNNNNWTPVNF